jgi:glutamate synthase domain-containing protein 3
MLRPQVFALYENPPPFIPPNEGERGGVQLGLVASERQAINAALRSLAAEDDRFLPQADRYWVARGGSHTDGGAFTFKVRGNKLEVADKFGKLVTVAEGQQHVDRARLNSTVVGESFLKATESQCYFAFDDGGPRTIFRWAVERTSTWTYNEAEAFIRFLTGFAESGGEEWEFARQTLTMLRNRRYDPGDKRRASLLTLWDEGLHHLFDSTFPLTYSARHTLRPPKPHETTLIVDCRDFPPEGDDSAARLLVAAYELGWRHLIAYNWRGGRFAACGLGPGTADVRVELYGDVGDYAASGLDGAEVHIHGDAQDQVGQILKDGTLVIHGDVGQTFLYGAKGGTIYVLGSAAGRPLINAVGRPRAVINGTCLDYLAESFMAGDPLDGGGFVVLNGITFDEHGQMVELETPYPGGNLFSLASGGSIYLRDPHRKVDEDQLNGGQFTSLSEADWTLIQPYLEENERQFGISVSALLAVNGEERPPADVYRKVEVRSLTALT